MSKIITGGRSVVSIAGADGVFKPIGIFDSCTVNESISSEDIHILGSFAPKEITLTAYNAVSVQCSGFRVYGQGVKILGKFPRLSDLLNLGPVTISIMDRENSTTPMMTVIGCLPDSNSNSFQTKATSKINISYKGTNATDEYDGNGSAGDSETNGETSLP